MEPERQSICLAKMLVKYEKSLLTSNASAVCATPLVKGRAWAWQWQLEAPVVSDVETADLETISLSRNVRPSVHRIGRPSSIDRVDHL